MLPKKDFEIVLEDKDYISFFKEGVPLVVLQKSQSYRKIYSDVILGRTQFEWPEFKSLLEACKTNSS